MKGNRQPPTVNLSESVCLATPHNKIYELANWERDKWITGPNAGHDS